MLSIIDEANLKEIMEFEMFVWMQYKMNPFELFSYMTMTDLHGYFEILHFKTEQRDKEQGGNKTLKMLSAIRDILNNMSLPDY